MPRTVMPVPDRPHPELVAGLAVLRAMLEEQRQFRLDQLVELAESPTCPATPAALSEPAVPPQPAPHWAESAAPHWAESDTAADRARREVTATLIAGARQALDDVEAALDRMVTGRYGLCTRCHNRISVERLYVIPQAGLCVDCQRYTLHGR